MYLATKKMGDSITFHSHILSQTPLKVFCRELEEEEARASEGNTLNANRTIVTLAFE